MTALRLFAGAITIFIIETARITACKFLNLPEPFHQEILFTYWEVRLNCPFSSSEKFFKRRAGFPRKVVNSHERTNSLLKIWKCKASGDKQGIEINANVKSGGFADSHNDKMTRAELRFLSNIAAMAADRR